MTNVSRLPVCPGCLAGMEKLAGLVCRICGERLPEQLADDPRCGLCRQEDQWPFERAVAYGSYESGLRDLIHLLKYDRVRPAASVLGRMLAEVIADLAPEFEGSLPVVVPVPLHAVKLSQRGFNQSALVAQAALKLRPAGLQLEMALSALIRQRPTESQTGLTRNQRQENIRGAFAADAAVQVDGKNILLVDDVFTTGTTVSECARVLRRAGAGRVWVAVVARVLKQQAAFAAPKQESERKSAPLAMAAGA